MGLRSARFSKNRAVPRGGGGRGRENSPYNRAVKLLETAEIHKNYKPAIVARSLLILFPKGNVPERILGKKVPEAVMNAIKAQLRYRLRGK